VAEQLTKLSKIARLCPAKGVGATAEQCRQCRLIEGDETLGQ
jgi:ribosomal protein L40E